jgi:hypothetical protein
VESIAQRIPGRAILDVGIGTGISAEPFRDRNFEILGVEPDPKMADLARAKGFKVESARFEEWDAAGRSFDALIAGQTWHWINPDTGGAKAASVLHDGAILALFWNSSRAPAELSAEFAQIFDSLDTGLPFNPWRPSSSGDPYGAVIDAAALGLSKTAAFGDVERLAFEWTTTMGRDAFLAQTKTAGGVNRLPIEKLDSLSMKMAAAIDVAGGEVALDYTTVVAVAKRVSPKP